ncbi:MAG: sugar ABC transporter permease [Paracoccaceae bacterium]|nr:sugar ABC transporter permease [Paracoccaceae bacterium]
MKQILDRLSPYFLAGPAVLVIGVACLYPTLMAVRLSFYKWSLGDPWSSAQWLGLSAFRQALTDPAVLHSLIVTVVFAAIVVSAEMVIGTALALLMERQVAGMSLFRTIFIMPMMVAPIVVGMIWRYVFDTQFGPANALLTALGLPAQSWLANPSLAFLAVVVSDIWQWTPFVIIMVLAGLQNLDQSALEAAQIDGATPRQVILRVKLPMLMPVLVITALMRLIDAFRVLEVIFALTFGGPGSATEVLPLHIYKTAFVGQQLGYASAISVLLLVVVFALSLATLALSNPLKDPRQ